MYLIGELRGLIIGTMNGKCSLTLALVGFALENPDFKGTINVNFIENAIATLNSQGEIKALWIKPVFRDDISLTI